MRDAETRFGRCSYFVKFGKYEFYGSRDWQPCFTVKAKNKKDAVKAFEEWLIKNKKVL